jgi:hypothetical protein
METNDSSSPDASSPDASFVRKGFSGLVGVLRQGVDAFREGMKEADEKEAAETAKQAEVLIEDIDWFKKSLAEIQEPGEVIHFQLEGVDLSGLVCTDRRVIIFHTGHFTWMLGNVKTFKATYDQITKVSLLKERLRISPLLGGGYVFEVVTADAQAGATIAGSFWEYAAEPNRVAFGKDKAPKLKKMLEFVQATVAATPKPEVTQPASVTGAEAPCSPLEMLEKLADLKAKGILTEEDFQAQKKKILERM